MKTYTAVELKEIVEKHGAWLKRDPSGVRADLRNANLSRANLCNADLRSAILSGANLYGADLRSANLRSADLRSANLRSADLYGANLRSADLSRADLYGADLSRADLSRANLRSADLRNADLYGAILSGAENLTYPIACPEKGSFIAFKKVRGDYIVELEILEDALRSSATSRKCRCSKARVISVTKLDGSSADMDAVYSTYDLNFAYRVGETVEVDNFDPNRWNECAPGIHFFITRQEAVDYIV